ncbi:IMP 5'-nucleotidase [Coemansia sp. RSA 2049]|nr:IMP 5'-nucleotidase [Coemansia sp. RSA 1939]KAJ2521783.1 IMP 5'-nucleotidase [Coemansia sp. RSA 2049]KAJ2615303.1 IMP 5'-nucleotidase [Coemansia sp. RSA 1804]KAJ2687919.1 IMP 5'-nucleotidase [Coemansia sp. RSA 1285]
MTSHYKVNYHLRAHKRDSFIEFIKGLLLTPFVLHSLPAADDSDRDNEEGRAAEADTILARRRTSSADAAKLANAARFREIFANIQTLVDEHRDFEASGIGGHSRLAKMVPAIGSFFTPLPLAAAFTRIDAKHRISARKRVPPSFNDVRRTLNMAQLLAIAPRLQLVTFDGDMTLYDDGKNFEDHSDLALLLVELLRRGIAVAIVTAAGYGTDASKYEGRLAGLLRALAAARLAPEAAARFYVLGGECNYLFGCSPDYRLVSLDEKHQLNPGEETADDAGGLRSWSGVQVMQLLDVAEQELRACIERMAIDARVIRKPRAVGIVPAEQLTREQLDECALSAQEAVLRYQGTPRAQPGSAPIPFCAFNGGSDCWVDIGNKLIGVRIIQNLVQSPADATLHVGDQFLSTGNDLSTRSACCTCWIINPLETRDMLDDLVSLLPK